MLRVASDEFKIEQNEDVIKSGIILLPSDLWPEIEEIARIRVENKILKSLREGQAETASLRRTPTKGVLGLTASRLFDRLSNKEHCYRAIISKANSENPLDRYYAYRFFNPERINGMLRSDETSQERAISLLRRLPLMVKDLKTPYMEQVIIETLTEEIKSNSTTIRKLLCNEISSIPSSFRDRLMKSIKSVAPEYHLVLEEAIENDDIPF